MIKSRMKRWERHTARVEEMRSAYIFVAKNEGERPF
jgi:hypothetical protein